MGARGLGRVAVAAAAVGGVVVACGLETTGAGPAPIDGGASSSASSSGASSSASSSGASSSASSSGASSGGDAAADGPVLDGATCSDRVMSLNGSTQWVEAADSVDFEAPRTVELWVRLTTARASATLVGHGDATSGWMLHLVAGAPELWTHGNGVKIAAARSATALAVGKWTHVAGVYDDGAGSVRLYVDGVLAQETAWPGGFMAIEPYGGPLTIGRASAAAVDHLPALVDDVRVSGAIEYTGTTPGKPKAPLALGGAVALWAMNDGAGVATVADAKGAHPGTVQGGASTVSDRCAADR